MVYHGGIPLFMGIEHLESATGEPFAGGDACSPMGRVGNGSGSGVDPGSISSWGRLAGPELQRDPVTLERFQ